MFLSYVKLHLFCQDIFEKSSLRQKMSCVLTGMDKWIEPNLKQPRSPELITRIYHIVGLIFSLMPSFIYAKVIFENLINNANVRVWLA